MKYATTLYRMSTNGGTIDKGVQVTILPLTDERVQRQIDIKKLQEMNNPYYPCLVPGWGNVVVLLFKGLLSIPVSAASADHAELMEQL